LSSREKRRRNLIRLGFPIQDVLNKPVTLEQVFSSLERIKKSPDFENDEMHGKQA